VTDSLLPSSILPLFSRRPAEKILSFPGSGGYPVFSNAFDFHRRLDSHPLCFGLTGGFNQAPDLRPLFLPHLPKKQIHILPFLDSEVSFKISPCFLTLPFLLAPFFP